MTTWFEGASGIRIAADQLGPLDGVPVILMGGLGQTRQSWSRTADRIAATGRRVLTLDLRGHGDSDRSPDGAYGFRDLSEDLRAVVASLGLPAVLVGASLGGKVALAAAGYGGPDVACGLVMIDTVPRNRPGAAGEIVQAMAMPPDGFASPDEAAAIMARARGREPRPGAGDRLRASLREDARGRWHWHWDPAFIGRDQGLGSAESIDYLEEAASRLRVPALVMRGELSPVVDAAGVAALLALAPHMEAGVIPGAGHMLAGDPNDAFADALLRFIGKLVPA